MSDGEQLMLYKDLGMISSVLDERRLPARLARVDGQALRRAGRGRLGWRKL